MDFTCDTRCELNQLETVFNSSRVTQHSRCSPSIQTRPFCDVLRLPRVPNSVSLPRSVFSGVVEAEENALLFACRKGHPSKCLRKDLREMKMLRCTYKLQCVENVIIVSCHFYYTRRASRILAAATRRSDHVSCASCHVSDIMAQRGTSVRRNSDGFGSEALGGLHRSQTFSTKSRDKLASTHRIHFKTSYTLGLIVKISLGLSAEKD